MTTEKGKADLELEEEYVETGHLLDIPVPMVMFDSRYAEQGHGMDEKDDYFFLPRVN